MLTLWLLSAFSVTRSVWPSGTWTWYTPFHEVGQSRVAGMAGPRQVNPANVRFAEGADVFHEVLDLTRRVPVPGITPDKVNA